VADLLVESSELTCIDVGGDMVPLIIDELPVLAVAACFASGTTNVRDAQELRVKESDRISTTVKELSALGARIEERPDGMAIEGTGRLTGSAVQSHGDHRLAMALAVAGLVAEGDTVVEGAEAVDVSYPQFWEHLQGLSGEAEIRASAVETTP
jgi:3-phosphoshikimate 1-carboxyvinyltransferase